MSEALPVIFEEEIAPKLSRLKTRLELALGRALAPADVEVLIANAFVYELQLVCITGNEAFRQSLVRFANGVMLEYLGELLGVSRLPSTGAQCTIQFSFVAGHNDVLLPAGIRVQTIDGNAIFSTVAAVAVPIGTDTVDVVALCQTPGVVGNDYDPGKVSIILDPQAFVTGAANTDITNGGIDEETDEQLRSRIALAPASFSVAGPSGAYKFFAKSAHPSIVDVAVITTTPGEVTLYPLCTGGELPSTEIKDSVLAICDDEKVRPQNDTVLVDDPTITEYAIEVELTIYDSAIPQEVLDAVNANFTAYVAAGENVLGRDVIVDQLIAQAVIPAKVYDVAIISPVANIVADENVHAKCTGVTVTITGTNNG
jgi:phage-related baseplate assembly protein